MKTLVLCRHAKAGSADAGIVDFDRALIKKGKQDIRGLSKRLAANLGKFDLLVTSNAKRAQETASLLAKDLKLKKKQLLAETALYEATSKSLLQFVRTLSDEIEKVILVGHNPAFEDFANLLVKNFTGVLPTSGIVGVQFKASSWKNVNAGQGRLVYFDFPKYKQAQSPQLKQFRSDLADELTNILAKYLGRLHPDVSEAVNSAIRKNALDIATTFTGKLEKTRSFAQLPQIARSTAPARKPVTPPASKPAAPPVARPKGRPRKTAAPATKKKTREQTK